MLTWYRAQVLLVFPIVWFFSFIVLLIPVIPAEFSMDGQTPILFGENIRVALVNTLIIPLLPMEQALSFVQWWGSATYLQHVLIMFVLSLNIFVPISLVIFVVITINMKIINWFKGKAIEAGRETARTL